MNVLSVALSDRSSKNEQSECDCQPECRDDNVDSPPNQPVACPCSLGANPNSGREMPNDHDPRDEDEPEQKRPHFDPETNLHEVDREHPIKIGVVAIRVTLRSGRRFGVGRSPGVDSGTDTPHDRKPPAISRARPRGTRIPSGFVAVGDR